MDLVDIELILKKQELELASKEVDSWSKKMRNAKEDYTTLLYIKELEKSNPDEYKKYIEYRQNENIAIDKILLKLDKKKKI